MKSLYLRLNGIRKTAEFAPGIPMSKAKANIPSVDKESDTVWEFVEQHHDAKRAGPHSDFRLSDGSRAFSWAVPKGLPTLGQRNLAVRQPDHTTDYLSFSGEITGTYGKGLVSILRRGQAKIISSSSSKVHFALLDKKNPEIYALIQTGGDKWILQNTTPTPTNYPKIPRSKPRYKNESFEQLDKYLGKEYMMEAKIDGAHVLYDFTKSNPQMFSYRPSKKGDAIINHTFISRLDEMKTPDEVKGMIFRGEVFATKDGKALAPRITAGILNSAPQKGLEKLKLENIEIKHALFDVVRKGKKDLELKPYKSKWDMLKDAVKVLRKKNFVLPATAISKRAKKKLLKKIQKGDYPLTTEGIVMWDLNRPNPPVKMKFKEHNQVHVVRVFEGMGKRKGMAGGFEYSLTAGGPIAGKVGTGFTNEMAQDLWDNKRKYKGKKAVITHRGQMPSGAYFQPVFSYWHM